MTDHILEFPKNTHEVVRIAVTEFRGRTYGDIRVYYEAEDGEWRPSRKGLTLAPDLIPELREGLEALERELRNRELIEDDDGE